MVVNHQFASQMVSTVIWERNQSVFRGVAAGNFPSTTIRYVFDMVGPLILRKMEDELTAQIVTFARSPVPGSEQEMHILKGFVSVTVPA